MHPSTPTWVPAIKPNNLKPDAHPGLLSTHSLLPSQTRPSKTQRAPGLAQHTFATTFLNPTILRCEQFSKQENTKKNYDMDDFHAKTITRCFLIRIPQSQHQPLKFQEEYTIYRTLANQANVKWSVLSLKISREFNVLSPYKDKPVTQIATT